MVEQSVYFLIPPVNFHASIAELDMQRDVVFHSVPGRVGNVIDDVGAPSRRFRLRSRWHDDVFRNDRMWADLASSRGSTVPKLVIMFFKTLWLAHMRIPITSPIITSFIRILNFRERLVEAKPDIFEVEMDFAEDLPYNMASVAGLIHLTSEGLISLAGPFASSLME